MLLLFTYLGENPHHSAGDTVKLTSGSRGDNDSLILKWDADCRLEHRLFGGHNHSEHVHSSRKLILEGFPEVNISGAST